MSGGEKMLRLEAQVDRLIMLMERMQLGEYIEYLSNRKRMIWNNLLAGMARGLGVAVGFTILGAMVIAILSRVAVDNIPLIGDFLAEVIKIVQERL